MRAKNPKLSCYNLVLGVPMEMAVEVDGKRWCGGDGVVVHTR